MDILERAKRFFDNLAPHVRERASAVLLEELIHEIEVSRARIQEIEHAGQAKQHATRRVTMDKAVIDELVQLRSEAKLRAEMFSEAVALQAKKNAISKGALRRYVCAVEADKLEALGAEASALEELLGSEKPPF